MHNFRVTVNGKIFEVTVEEAGSAKNEINTKAVEEAAAAVIPAKTVAAQVSTKETVLESGEQPVTAPLSGSILEIKVKAGERVKFGQVLLTLEALKMENEIVAPQDGVVKNIFVQQGSMVNVGEALLSLAD